jgi:tetratricopeptide (TPR) repeat protein
MKYMLKIILMLCFLLICNASCLAFDTEHMKALSAEAAMLKSELEKQPESFWVNRKLGLIYFEMYGEKINGKVEEKRILGNNAISYLDKAVDIYESNHNTEVVTNKEIIQIYSHLGLLSTVNNRPKDALYYYNRMHDYCNEENHDDSYKAFAVEAYVGMASSYTLLSDNNNAYKMCQKGLKIDPNNEDLKDLKKKLSTLQTLEAIADVLKK